MTAAACAVHADRAASFTCTRCGNFGCGDCAFWPVAVEMRCRHCTRDLLAEPVPWERRKELGMFRAAARTSKLVVTSPVRFFRTPSILAESSSEPVYFAMLLYAFAFGLTFTIAGLVLAGVAVSLSSFSSNDGTHESSGMLLLMSVCYPLLGFLVGPVSGGFYVVFASALNWVACAFLANADLSHRCYAQKPT